MSFVRPLLGLGIAVPVLYFGTLFAAAATWPGYSHVTRYASELGGPEAPLPWIFNGGIILMGGVCVLAAIGFGIVLVRITGRAALGIATAICIGLFGVSMLIGGAFPMPNPLHGAFGLAFALVPAPVLMALALRRVPGLRGLRNLLWVNAVLNGLFPRCDDGRGWTRYASERRPVATRQRAHDVSLDRHRGVVVVARV